MTNEGISVLQENRKRILELVDATPEEQLARIPDGFNNNMLWNFGHIIVTQQLLHYSLSGLPMSVDKTLVGNLRKGTSPKTWSAAPALALLKTFATELPAKLEADYAEGMFQTYTEYTTSAGVVLRSIKDAIQFNNFHEGIHLGVMMALRKLTRA